MNFNEYQKEAMKVRLRSADTLYAVMGLAEEAGEVAGKFAKFRRDEGFGAPINALRESVKKELGDVLWMMAAVAYDMDLKLEEIAEANIAKLNSRKERGVLGGSGDNR